MSDKLHYKRGKAYSLYGYRVVESTLYKQFEYFTKSLELFQEIKDRFGIGLNLIKIGYIYFQIGEPEKAIAYYKQALTVKKEVNDIGGIALTLTEIGHDYKSKNEPGQALSYFRESLKYLRQAGVSGNSLSVREYGRRIAGDK